MSGLSHTLVVIAALAFCQTSLGAWQEHEKFLLSAKTTKAAIDSGYQLPDIVDVHWGSTTSNPPKKAVVILRKKELNPSCPPEAGKLGYRTEGFWAIFEDDYSIGSSGSEILECDMIGQ